MRPIDLRPAAALAEVHPHGTRIRYVGGCHCVPCRAANSRYESARLIARRSGDWNGIVSAVQARRHLRALSKHGVGRRTVSDISGVSQSIISNIKNGQKSHIRARTARQIFLVTHRAVAAGRVVPAKRVWKMIDELREEGFSKAELARRLGYKTPALQFKPDLITGKTLARVERLYRRILWLR